MFELTPWFGWTMLGVGLVGLVIYILFLLNLRSLLAVVDPSNRKMEPDMVWLNLIPVFQWAWMIITVIRIRDSVTAESRRRGLQTTGDSAFGVGMTYAVISIFSGVFTPIRQWGVPGLVRPLGALGGLVGLVGLICWILYWIRTAESKRRLREAPPPPQQVIPPAQAVPPAQPPQGQQPTPGGEGEGTGATASSCPYCGAPYKPGGKFCSSCGRPAS